MREIKFRAWCPVRNKVYEPFSLLRAIKEEGVSIHNDDVFMQYTGLTDKNSKEIYEGDIVCYVTDEVVEVIGGYPRTEPEGNFLTVEIPSFYTFDFEEYPANEMEIIGNIYENPELTNNHA